MYDPVGQLIEERAAYSPGPPALPGQEVEPIAAFTMTHAYDELGNRVQTILPNGRRIDTLRYGSGHWHGTLWQGKSIVDLERDHLHRETVRELGTATERLTERRTYDPQSRLSGFTLDQGNKRLRERHYEYDATGNLLHIADEHRGSIRYTYDPLGQLLSAVQPGLTETFAFDPAGNLLDPDTAAAPIDTRQVLRELDDQPSAGTRAPRLPKVTHNLLRQYMGYEYEYDVQGNTVVKRPRVTSVANEEGVLTFEYDADNQLTTAVRTSATSRMVARYSYDAFGRRIAKRVDEHCWAEGKTPPPIGQAHTGQLTLFVWDGDVMVQEVHAAKTITYVYEPQSFIPLARVESMDGADAFGTPITYLEDVLEWDLCKGGRELDAHVMAYRISTDEARKRAHNGNWSQRICGADVSVEYDVMLHYRCDHLGTPLELIDGAGVVKWSIKFRAWGSTFPGCSQGVSQPLRFQGQYLDAETSVHYNRFRYYDPAAGRFLTQDPIRLGGGENLYRYASNSTGWVDPLGLMTSKDCCCPKLLLLSPKEINFAQRTVNAKFDVPGGKISIDKAISLGPAQVAAFPPIRVVNVKGQWVARDGNSRLVNCTQD